MPSFWHHLKILAKLLLKAETLKPLTFYFFAYSWASESWLVLKFNLLLVLSVLQAHVLTKVKDYYTKLRKEPQCVNYPNFKQQSLKERLLREPTKTATKFKLSETQLCLKNHNELARLYLSPNQLIHFDSFEDCTDVRVLLSIMVRKTFKSRWAIENRRHNFSFLLSIGESC